MKEDLYQILGIDRNAEPPQIKRAFRKIAMKYHPDRNPDDKQAESKFKDAQQAHDILSDPQKRAAYDRYGHQAFEHGGMGGADMHGADFGDVFNNIFEGMFGGGAKRGGRTRQARGRSQIRLQLELELEEAAFGREKSIEIPVESVCSDCKGTGSKNAKRSICPDCGGTGQLEINRGIMFISQTCPSCQGAGQVISDPCSQCSASGYTSERKKIKVQIPAGVDSGSIIRVQQQNTDILLQISITPHDIFTRHDEDLHLQVPITIITATLGGKVEIPLLGKGKAELNIPPETQYGKQFRIRGKGMPYLRRNEVGDLICHVLVETPVNLSKRQKELLYEFDDTNANHPSTKKWLDKIINFWDS